MKKTQNIKYAFQFSNIPFHCLHLFSNYLLLYCQNFSQNKTKLLETKINGLMTVIPSPSLVSYAPGVEHVFFTLELFPPCTVRPDRGTTVVTIRRYRL